MSESKPFGISKKVVHEAYLKVKANKGAAGVDGESIEEFESNLKGNLYKLWNRLSSGSYFPPPVRAVEIPKPGGRGKRVLGVPTVADRIAQTVTKMYLEPPVQAFRLPSARGSNSCLDASRPPRIAAHERVLVSGAEEELLIEALLTLARGQTGLNRKEPFDLAALAKRVLLMRDPELKQRNLELGSSLSTASARGDPILVERLVANLVDNALRYNVANGRLEVGTETRDGKAVLSVVNTGPVVPATVVERLFEPFQRLGPDRTGHREGVGLGLSIVRAIADAHDAAVQIRARPEGGLVIEVAFPAADAS